MAEILKFAGECEECGEPTKSRREKHCHICKSIYELDPTDIGIASNFFEQSPVIDSLDPTGKIFDDADAVNISDKVIIRPEEKT